MRAPVAAELAQDIIEHLPDATFVIDGEKRVVAWNRAIEAMTGVPRAVLLGRGDGAYAMAVHGRRRTMLIDLVGGGHPESAGDYLRFDRQGEFVFAEGYVPRLHDGRGAYVWGMAGPLRDRQGNAYGAIESIRDLSERRNTEVALRDSEERFRTLFDKSPDGIFLTDPETQEIVDCNHSACAMNGYTREELVGQNINVLHPEDVARRMTGGVEGRRAFVEELGRSGVVTVETVHRRKDGTLFLLETSMCLLTVGGRLLVMGIDRDITDRKRAENELRLHRDHLEELVAARTAELAVAKERAEAADRVKSAFLAAMSHELRTPLNSILGFTGILLRGLAGPLNEEQRRQLGMVASSSAHLLELINDVLDLSKIEAGQLKVEAEEFDLRMSITRVLMAISPLADKKQLKVTRKIDPEIGNITSDRRRVEQVLLNLLSNAVKFTDEGEISVECAAHGNHVVIGVRDTGIGIKSEDLERLFRPFQQLDSGLSRVYDGTGLGLSICKRIIELLGGEISVESQVGRGSTFSFSLPVRTGRQE